MVEIFEEGLVDKVVLEKRSEISEGKSHIDIGGKNSPGKDNGRLKVLGQKWARVLEKE